MSLYDQLIQSIGEGESGINKGIPMGLPKLQGIVNGIQKKRYDLVFGAEGTGKSALVANTYVLNPFEWYWKYGHKHTDLKIRWYSLEVDGVSTLSKCLAWKIYKEYGVVTSPNNLLSKGSNNITQFEKDRLKEFEGYFESFLDTVTIIDIPMSPSEIRDDIEKFAKSRGYFKKDNSGIVRYHPHKREHVIIITDTLGNLKIENINGRFDKKGTIDHHSALSRDYYRNTLYYTVCNVTHSNRAISGMDRAKYGEIFPNKDDIKDTGQPSFDANTVIAIFNPMDYMNSNNTLSKFMGYDIGKLTDRFRALGVLKNREGSSNKRVGCLYIGENGYFQELPKSDQMLEKHYDSINNIVNVPSNILSE